MISDFAVSFALLEQYISFVVFFSPSGLKHFCRPMKNLQALSPVLTTLPT